jgi:hypothetical protein
MTIMLLEYLAKKEGKMKKVRVGALILIAAYTGYAIPISGKVTNASGQALSGVVVQLLALQLKDTTGSDGIYTLKETVAIKTPIADHRIFNDILYRNNRFFLHASTPAITSVKIYSLTGRLVATVFEGLLQKGTTEVPFSQTCLGKSMYAVRICSGTDRVIGTLVAVGDQDYRITALSGPTANSLLAKTAAADWLQATKTGYTSYLEQMNTTSVTIDITLSPVGAAPDFGSNTLIFDPTMATNDMQSKISGVIGKMESAQFSSDRYALLFKPGKYNLDVHVGFYTEALGLGLSPEDVVIHGAIRVETNWMGSNATCNFWRSAAGICVEPASTNNTIRWAVAQATPFRRMHVKGNLEISADGWASGGYTADSKVDGTIKYKQQQWFSRNSDYGTWNSPGWSFVFVGNTNPPTPKWPDQPYTVIPKTPIIREKPFLCIDDAGNYGVMVPELKRDSSIGVSWAKGPIAGTTIPIDLFYIAHAGTDNASTINAALDKGKNLLFTPGIYRLDASIKVTRPGTVVLGIGLPSLIPEKATPAIEAADVDGLKIGGFLVDASPANPIAVRLRKVGLVYCLYRERKWWPEPPKTHGLFLSFF